MKIAEAISLVDKLKPNHYDNEIKIQWLSKLDGQIFVELICLHERDKNMPQIFEAYTENDMDKELLVPFPYAQEMYSNYLMAQIDRANGEDARYNQSIALYNAAFNRYQAWYRREHKPLSRGRFRF